MSDRKEDTERRTFEHELDGSSVVRARMKVFGCGSEGKSLHRVSEVNRFSSSSQFLSLFDSPPHPTPGGRDDQ